MKQFTASEMSLKVTRNVIRH